MVSLLMVNSPDFNNSTDLNLQKNSERENGLTADDQSRENIINQIIIEAEAEKQPWWGAVKRYLKYLANITLTTIAAIDDPNDIPEYLETASPPEEAKVARDDSLEKWNQQYNEHFPIREITPQETGAIVIWIGIGRKPDFYQEQIDFFTNRGFKVYCCEWPKFDKNGGFNFAQHPNWMKEKLASWGINENNPATMIGHSRGGLALLEFAKDEDLAKMIKYAVISSVPAGHGPEKIPQTLFKLIKKINDLPAEKMSNLMGKLKPRVGDSETLAFFAQNDPHELTDCYLDHMEKSWVEIVQAVPNLPIVFTRGETDSIVEIVGNRAIEGKENSIILEYPNRGHALPEGENLYRCLGWCIARANGDNRAMYEPVAVESDE